MKVKEMKEILARLVYQELEEEHNYQVDGGEQNKQYLAQLICCYQWLIKGTSMPIVENLIIEDMIKKYLKDEG